MEERKRMGPLGRVLLVLLFLVLGAGCFLSAGLGSWTPESFPWGVYTTGEEDLYLSQAYQQTTPRDVLITRRDALPADGALVTYQQNGRRVVDLYDDLLGRPVLAEEGDSDPEPVIHVVRELGYVLRQLWLVRYFVWGGTAAVVILCIVLRATAFSRWKKRQQKLMEENFRRFGEKYAQDDEDMDY